MYFEWLCTQIRKNPEVAIMLGAVARYRRARVGSSYNDAHTDNSRLHKGAVRPYTGFLESLFLIKPRTGHVSSHLLVMLTQFFLYFVVVRFSCGGTMHQYFTAGPSRQRRGTRFLSRRACPSEISWRTLFLATGALYLHRAGFEPKRASSFRRRVKFPNILGEATRA